MRASMRPVVVVNVGPIGLPSLADVNRPKSLSVWNSPVKVPPVTQSPRKSAATISRVRWSGRSSSIRRSVVWRRRSALKNTPCTTSNTIADTAVAMRISSNVNPPAEERVERKKTEVGARITDRR